MSRQARICGVNLGSVGVLAVLLYVIDRTIAQALDAYVPGEDYPVYTEVPEGLSFTCDDKIPGYYADPETQCQVWHWCVPSIGGNIKYSFLCGPGTVFNQRTRVCDWFFKTDCPNAVAYYGVNEDLYKDEAGNYINGKK
ncbi:U-scoloptoxin(01)-Cw1a-like [Pectinophora gossypiella]|uniref:U-scoloptoxin(01)-Cw1a-like n=1 Tax=Pectinophora gossypiella TaxID=13191 RepID=UPI00214EB299|nr:U-scoloptoxin(01)-Cw1a-like [Pectinophora gossypiella]